MEQDNLKRIPYFLLFCALLVVYILGLLAPMIDEDCTHHANIALHMYLHHEYINLIDNGNDYLDKPHLHFWLASISYHLFGVNNIAYRLPSVLITFLGIYSTYRLGRLFYTKQVGLLAALILASVQAFILANMDVRMDAILTASIIFAIWQLAEAVSLNKWYNYLLGALGLAMGFSTKGMVGFMMPGIAIFCLLLYKREWKAFFNPKWLLMMLYYIIFISPVLYAYYVQYDLHPEKIIRGMNNISGVKFILWSQNFERMAGTNWGKAKVDYFFFLHTLLWAFLPWCLLTYHAIFDRIIFFIKTKFRYQNGIEFLTLGTTLLILIIISTSKYKLPHYLNILFPVFAILTAAQFYFNTIENRLKTFKVYLGLQYFVMGVCLLLSGILTFWVFPIQSFWIAAIAFFFLMILIWVIIKERGIIRKTVIISVLTSVLVNVLMNGNFYPQLSQYDAGTTLAAEVKKQEIIVQDIYKYKENHYTFDFYTKHLTQPITFAEMENQSTTLWVLTNEEGYQEMKKTLPVTDVISKNEFGITRLKGEFLNPNSRNKVLRKSYLVRIN
ncbi:ArnT family glycosyltransferase [Pedobacter cryophilus]|uniref:Glycosyltransferase family 39 protein n=1 Tax=Pedobacter cryophilus TaxID=2571271 RepID=A0A4U1BUG6_9SPHI|nr:glycosyltransferase family 39 protein [Pedobacter cryophilus]TKB96288.1 glycosyltransferase family 39 protein [Pedobacter cryophilus]